MPDRRFEMLFDGPAQAPVAYDDVDDAASNERRFDAAARRLYFRKLGDRGCRPGKFEIYLIFDSLYGTCLRATGSNFMVSILSGWSRLFFVVV
jgi:hypothetical protein